MGFTIENAKAAADAAYELGEARKAWEALKEEGAIKDGLRIHAMPSRHGIQINRSSPLYSDAKSLLLQAAAGWVAHYEQKLRDLGAEVPE